jgi:hypothetical protein
MENVSSYQLETNQENITRLNLRKETAINMIGVILFYVVLFVAVNVLGT